MGSTMVGILRDLAQYPPQHPAARKDLYNAALQLVYATESAQDTAQRLYHGHVPLAMAQTSIDLNLFNIVAKDQEREWSNEELAAETGADPALMHRITRCLTSYGMLEQSEKGTYSASNISKNLSIPGTAAGIKHYSLTMTPAYNAIPKFLAQNGYKNPSDKAPFNLAYNTEMPVFEWRKHNPENAKAGQAFMAAQRMGQRSLWESRQIQLQDFKLSPEELTDGRTLMVDVGGGLGHQCIDLRQRRPDVKGKLVTQDLPMVHDMISNKEEMKTMDIETMEHNFMEAQPVHGAKVYYLRNVIHNWNDEPSKVILSQIKAAMAADSVVIIDDVVMPRVGATWKQASMDIAMMTMLAAVERTGEHFGRLLAEVGLEIRDIWTYDEEYGDSLIVAVPKTQQHVVPDVISS